MEKDKQTNMPEVPSGIQEMQAQQAPPPAGELANKPQNMPAPAAPYNLMMEPVPTRKKKLWTKKKVIGLVAAVLAVLLVGWMVVQAIQGPGPTPVQTQAVARGDVRQSLATSGNLTTSEKITIFSPVSAPVVKVNVQQGSQVKAGDMMFTYDVKALERAYRTASASSASASDQARVANEAAQKSVEEWQESVNSLEVQVEQQKSAIKGLQDRLAVTPADIEVAAALEAANMQLSVLEQQLAAARKMLETALKQQDDAKKSGGYAQVPAHVAAQNAWDDLQAARKGVVAPIGGIITGLTVVEGGLAAQYSLMCTIESLEKVDVVVALSRYDLERVSVGQKAVIKTLELEYEATVSKIDGMATQGTTGSYVAATVSITKPDNKIRLGLEANVNIETGVSKNALWVSLSAINTDVDGTYGFVAEEGIAHRRPITIGLSNDSQVEIVSGLSEGEKVILYSQNIMQGMEVADMGDTAVQGGAGGVGGGMVVIGNKTKKGLAV